MITNSTQLSQGYRAAGCVGYGLKWIIFTDIISLYSTTVTYLASEATEIGEKKRKIRDITKSKVIQGHRGRYQSKDRMRLPISCLLYTSDAADE